MQITTVGIDLAKNVFQVHGVNERGKALLKKRLRRVAISWQHSLSICRPA